MKYLFLAPALIAIALPSSCVRSKPAATVAAGVTPVQTAQTPNPSTDSIWICPMDRDIRKHNPGTCPRCGMKLVTDIPEPVEYHMDLAVSPAPMPGQRVRLTLEVFDPWKGNPVKNFSIVHEKLFHAFIVSRDLSFFVHDHPEWNGTSFTYDIAFPKAGMYRVLGDFYPEASTPQLITQTVFVPGDEYPIPPLTRDYAVETGREPERRRHNQPRGARGRRAHAAPFHARSGGRTAEISWRVGTHAGGKRRFDRHDAHASVYH